EGGERLVRSGFSARGRAGVAAEAARKEVDRQLRLAMPAREHRDGVERLDGVVADRETADRHAASMDEDVPAGRVTSSARAVESIRIGHAEREVMLRAVVEAVEAIEALWHLTVVGVGLGPEDAALGADMKGADEDARQGPGVRDSARMLAAPSRWRRRGCGS